MILYRFNDTNMTLPFINLIMYTGLVCSLPFTADLGYRSVHPCSTSHVFATNCNGDYSAITGYTLVTEIREKMI